MFNMSTRKDLSGQKFGRWTVIRYSHTDEWRNAHWLCICECGTEKTVKGLSLMNTTSKSCGCLMRDLKTTHGQFGTRLYHIWDGIIQRCTNKGSVLYKGYGSRGISVCNEWVGFEGFYEWAMANGYSDALTIDRINNDGNYEPSNCRWADKITQQNNRRCNRRITYKGREQTLTQWARELNLTADAIRQRLNAGWNIERAIEEPITIRQRKL